MHVRQGRKKTEDALFTYLFLKSIIPLALETREVDRQLCLVSQRSPARLGSKAGEMMEFIATHINAETK